MNIPTLLSESNVQALGWMLLHFVWQGLALAAVFTVTRVVVVNPRLRYVIACVALFSMVLLPLATLLSHEADTPSGLTPSGLVDEFPLGEESTVATTARGWKPG